VDKKPPFSKHMKAAALTSNHEGQKKEKQRAVIRKIFKQVTERFVNNCTLTITHQA